MDPNLLLPGLSALDAAMQIVSIMVHIAVGMAALAQAPRDPRTRVFAALTLLNGGGAGVPIVFWWLGISNPLAGGRLPLGFMLACLTTSSLALFHLSQVFPVRRSWIRGAGIQLPIAYALTPVAVLLLVKFAPMKDQAGSAIFALLAIAFGFAACGRRLSVARRLTHAPSSSASWPVSFSAPRSPYSRWVHSRR